VTPRDDLLLTAERLFALHGIDAVSLRRIGVEAGQRNVAAIQYHFGDKTALVQAIFDHRLDSVDARRREMLALLCAEGRKHDVHALIDALVRPLAEQAARVGSHYARFLNRVCEHAGQSLVPLSAIAPVNSAVEIGHLVIDELGALPEPFAAQRSELAGRMIIAALAELEHRTAVFPRTVPDADLYTLGLVDAVVGLLTAPVSVPGPSRHPKPISER